MWLVGFFFRNIYYLINIFYDLVIFYVYIYLYLEYILKIDSIVFRIIESKWELLIREVRGVNDWRYVV